MAEASDTLIQSLNSRIDTLTRELAETRTESKNRKLQLRKLNEQITTLTTERDTHAKAVENLTTERDGLKTQLTSAPNELQTKIAELQGQIRTRTHKERFAELAKAAGCDPTAVEAAWKLSGYQAEADDVDDARLNEAIGKAKTDLPVAFSAAQTGTGAAAAAKKPLAPGPGSERGASQKTTDTLRVTKSQMKDYAWVKANQAAMSEAQKAGTFELIEG